MSQEKILNQLIAAQQIKIRNLEIKVQELRKQLIKSQVKAGTITINRNHSITHAKVATVKGYKPKALTRTSLQQISKTNEKAEKKLKNLAKNEFAGLFFYKAWGLDGPTQRENTGIGISITNIIYKLFPEGEERQKMIDLVKRAISQLSAEAVANVWVSEYQEQAEGYGQFWSDSYSTDAVLGARFIAKLTDDLDAKENPTFY